MALPTNGKISVSDILAEMERLETTTKISDLADEWYVKTGKSKFQNPPHPLSQWYGEEWDTSPPVATLSLHPTSYNGDYFPESLNINVTCSDSWTVTIIDSWGVDSVTPMSGNGNGLITLILLENRSPEFRQGRIRVQSTGVERFYDWSQTGRPAVGEGGGDSGGSGGGTGGGGNEEPNEPV